MDCLDDFGSLGRRLGQQCSVVFTERHDHRHESVVGRQMAFIKLVDVGVDRIDVLYKPLPLSLEASRGVKRPDYQRSPLLEPAYDLGRNPIYSSFDATNHLSPIPPNRNGLPEHRRRGDNHFSRSPDIQLDQFWSQAMRLSPQTMSRWEWLPPKWKSQ